MEWKQNGQTLEDSGGELVINNLDIPYAGNYSCWAGPRLLHSFYVVMWLNHSYFFKAEGEQGREGKNPLGGLMPRAPARSRPRSLPHFPTSLLEWPSKGKGQAWAALLSLRPGPLPLTHPKYPRKPEECLHLCL